MTKEEIKEAILKNKDLLRRYKVKSIALFGSYARGEQTEDSDVDLLVEFDSGVTLFDIVDLQDDLSELLGRRVHVVSKRGLSRHIGPSILKEAEAIGERL